MSKKTKKKKASKAKTQRSKFIGIVPLVKRFFLGATKLARISSIGSHTTPRPAADSDTDYESMSPEGYRWFRQDEVVRRCVITNAAFAVMAAGFETELEPVTEIVDEKDLLAFKEKFKFVKDYVDAANRQVNLDAMLFVAQVKRSIFGKAGFEIVKDKNKPDWLLTVNSTKITVDLDDDWSLNGYKVTGVDETYKPEDFLYFPNLSLEADREGLSDIEPVYSICKSRNNLLCRDLPEITRSLWAPYVILSADTTGMTDAEETSFLNDLIEAAKSGKSIAINKLVNAVVVERKINLTGINALLDKLEECIIREFGTPRFLVNKRDENRATSYTAFEGYVEGTLKNIQRFFKRELEKQWYPQLVKLALKSQKKQGAVEVKISHEWNLIRGNDLDARGQTVAALYASGLGILADYPELAFDMMGWEKTLLEEKQKEEEQIQTESEETTITLDKPNEPDEDIPGTETVEE